MADKKIKKVYVYMYERMGGCQLYRQLSPNMLLGQYFPDEYHIKFHNNLSMITDEELKTFDLVCFHKGLMNTDQFKRIKDFGIQTVVDFDDFWALPSNHLMYKFSQKEKSQELLTYMLQYFDAVTCSTERLAKEVRKHNGNVWVLPNAIDPTWPQYEIKKTFYPKVGIGWIGGMCHLPDIAMLKDLPGKLYWNADTIDKYILQLFGYEKGNIFEQYAAIMSDLGKYPLDLIPPRDGLNYTQFYNSIDIALIPLRKDKFNSLKSELKVVEAGFFKKAIICSDVHPYRGIIKHGHNALVVKKDKDWFTHCRTLINDEDLRNELGQNLYDTVKDDFDQRNLVAKRKVVYDTIIANGKKSIT